MKIVIERRCTLASVFACLLLSACGGSGLGEETSATPVAPAKDTLTLQIAPIAQQTEVWCWAATAEMVFRYYGLPNLNPQNNYQCGIVAAYAGPQSICFSNCLACVEPIGAMSNTQTLINGYGLVARQYAPSKILSSRIFFNSLLIDQVAGEISAGRPVIAGISPNGFKYPNFSQHVVLIVGYDVSGISPRIVVNDPFPYNAFPFQPDPYLIAGGFQTRPGQYSISYSAVVVSLNWANTIDQIK